MARRSRLTGPGLRLTHEQKNHSMMVCTLTPQSLKTGTCERRAGNVDCSASSLATASADGSCSGSAAHHHPHATNLVLWHMRIPLPWHLHLCLRMIAPLPCHQTRLRDARLFPFSFASGPEIGTTCALRAPPAIRFDVSLIATLSVVLQLPHTLMCKDETHFYHDTVTTATSAERKGFHSPTTLFALHFGALYPAFHLFWSHLSQHTFSSF